MKSFATELDTQFSANLEANHVIDPSQVWVSCLPTGPNGTSLKGVYSNIESLQYQDDIGEAIYKISGIIPFGILCFLPSYNAMDKLLERWDLTGIKDQMETKKRIFSEPKGSDKKVFEKAIKKFYEQIDKSAECPTKEKGAIFFAVYRGKVSEGIDFTNEYCRAVIALGIPYPGIKDMEVKLKKEYNDQKRMKSRNSNFLSGRDWYSVQAYRAINQALGRCIRHKNDWGAIILLEDRFQAQETIKGLSKWIRGKVQTYRQFSSGMDSLKSFVQGRLRIQGGINQEQLTKPEIGKQLADEADGPIGTISKAITEVETTKVEQKTTKTEGVCSPLIGENKDPVAVQNDTHIIKAIFQEQSDIASGKKAQKVNNDNSDPYELDVDHTTENKTEQMADTADSLDNLIIEIDSDMELELSDPTPQAHSFFKKPPKTFDEIRTVVCSRCEHVLAEGDTSLLKPVDNIHLNCILYSNRMDTRMLEVQKPSTWKTTTLNLNISQLPTECQVLMNQEDKLCYQKMYCKCNQVIGVLMCGAISPEKEKYVGKVFFWEDSVKYEKERQRAWTQSVKKDDADDSWNDTSSSQVATMTDMFYNLP